MEKFQELEDNARNIDFTIKDSKGIKQKALKFNIQIHKGRYRIIFKPSKKTMPFDIISRQDIDNKILTRPHTSKYGSLKNNFIQKCEIYQKINDNKTKKELWSSFLINVIYYIDNFPLPKKEKRSKESKVERFEVSNDLKKEVNRFLKSENKLNFIRKCQSDIIGEDDTKVLIVALLLGSYLNKPQNILISAESSSGKSIIQNNATDLLPSSTVAYLTGSSEKAIIYKDYTNILILSISELQRNPELLEHLKDMGDKGIFYSTVIKDPETGEFKEQLISIGRVGVIGTTTKEYLNTEFENRAWKIETDMSTKQTHNIIGNSLANKSDRIKARKLEKIIKKKKNIFQLAIQTMQKEYDFDDIECPFAKELGIFFIYDYMRVRRDHHKFIDLLQIISSLHFRIRDYYIEDGVKTLLVHPNDLRQALKIGGQIFMYLSQNLSKEKVNILSTIREMTFTTTDKKEQTLFMDLAIIDGKAGKEVLKKFKTSEISNAYNRKIEYKKSSKSFRNMLNDLAFKGHLILEKKGRSNTYSLNPESHQIIKPINYKSIERELFNKYNERINELRENKDIKFFEIKKRKIFDKEEDDLSIIFDIEKDKI